MYTSGPSHRAGRDTRTHPRLCPLWCTSSRCPLFWPRPGQPTALCPGLPFPPAQEGSPHRAVPPRSGAIWTQTRAWGGGRQAGWERERLPKCWVLRPVTWRRVTGQARGRRSRTATPAHRCSSPAGPRSPTTSHAQAGGLDHESVPGLRICRLSGCRVLDLLGPLPPSQVSPPDLGVIRECSVPGDPLGKISF